MDLQKNEDFAAKWCPEVGLARAGFLSPASRGALLTAMLVMYLLLALGAGFASVWLWGLIQRSYDGWSGVAWRVASYFPGITLATLSCLNILLVHTGSSGAIPLTAFFFLISLWFIISIPLCFSGAAPPSAPPVPSSCSWLPLPPCHLCIGALLAHTQLCLAACLKSEDD